MLILSPVIDRLFPNRECLCLLLLLGLPLCSLTLSLGAAEAADTMQSYKIPGTANGSRFNVSVNGIPVQTYDMVKPINGCTLARFAFTGLARVTVQINGGWAASAILSPQKYGIPFTREGNTIFFTIDCPRKLVIRDPTNQAQLLLVADGPEASPLSLGQAGVVNAATFNPDATGIAEATNALQAAINATPANGSLYIGPGIYKIGQLNLKSNFTLYLHHEALLQARLDTNPSWGQGMINLENCDNVTVRGRGAIHGNGMHWRYHGGWYGLIACKNVNNITFRDLLLLEPCVEFMSINACNISHVDNLNMIAPVDYENSDGFSLTGSGFLIEKCLIWNTDASIGPTAYEGVGSADINVRNCVFNNPIINYPSNGTSYPMTMMKDYTYENIDWPTTNMVTSLWSIGGANLDNLWYKNLRVESWYNWTSNLGPDFYESYPMDCNIMVADWDPNSTKARLGYIHNVNFSGFYFDSLPTKRSSVQGWDATRNITATFNDFRVGGVLCSNPEAGGLNVKNTYKPNTSGTFAALNFTGRATPEVSIQTSSPYARRGGSAVSLMVRRSGSTAASLTVNLLRQGNAVQGTDYETIPNSVTFPIGVAEVSISVTGSGSGPPCALIVALDNVRLSDTWTLGARYHAMVTINLANGLQNFRSSSGLATDGSQDLLTPANDGLQSLLKYALNMIGTGAGQETTLAKPNRKILTANGNSGLPLFGRDDDGRLSITYIRRKASASPGVTYSVEFSATATTWAPNTSANESVVSIDAELERVTVADSIGNAERRFVRVKVTN